MKGEVCYPRGGEGLGVGLVIIAAARRLGKLGD
jgi:hypothetical protein